MVAGAYLVCNCHAGQRGMICQHRALVHERIEDELQAERTARRVDTPAGAATPAVTTASRGTRSALAKHPGDTALMRRSNRPFSLLKV